MKEREIRAQYDANTIVIYQAYRPEIALAAVKAQKFVSPFKMGRMTWIKPSFLWMMYRAGWATKEGQEHILAIRLKREGFEWALQNSCLSHFDGKVHPSYDAWKHELEVSPVRIQWDPEKDIFLQNLSYRSIQIGLSGVATDKYVNEWTVEIKDITEHCKTIHKLIQEKSIEKANESLPVESVYALSETIAEKIYAG